MSGVEDFRSCVERARAVAAKLSIPSNKRPHDDSSSDSASQQSKRQATEVNPYINIINNASNNIPNHQYNSNNNALSNNNNSHGNNSSNNSSASSTTNSGYARSGGNVKGNTIFKPTSIYLDGVIMNGEKTLDMMIEGSKVGYVIGKGGDMIRTLQERANVKMTVIQASSEVTEGQKQLRIVGEPNKVDYARQLVNDLLIEKELEVLKYKNKQMMNNGNGALSSVTEQPGEYGSSRSGYLEIPVSPQYIGLVIGKGGENIKRIQQETGAKVQFDTTKSDANGNKVCQITCQNLPALNIAAQMVREVLENAINARKAKESLEEVRITVPFNKTGIVIGKGGETIKAIKQQCGCNIELEKGSKGVFIIRGPPERIPYAQQLINEKANGMASSTPSQSSSMSGYGSVEQYWNAAQTYYQQAPSSDVTQQQSGDASQNSNAAAWAAYYAQYYAQQQQLAAQSMVPQQASGVPAPSAPTPTSVAASTPAPPQANGTDQSNVDYSAQWAEYYRYYGMEKEAEMIEQMSKSKPASEHAQTATSSEERNDKVSQSISYPGYSYAGYNQNTNDKH